MGEDEKDGGANTEKYLYVKDEGNWGENEGNGEDEGNGWWWRKEGIKEERESEWVVRESEGIIRESEKIGRRHGKLFGRRQKEEAVKGKS